MIDPFALAVDVAFDEIDNLLGAAAINLPPSALSQWIIFPYCDDCELKAGFLAEGRFGQVFANDRNGSKPVIRQAVRRDLRCLTPRDGARSPPSAPPTGRREP
jgi:hypothetical protein